MTQWPNDSITQFLNPLMNGVIILDKPSGWTSHDVVARMRRILKQRSIGHLGTLDPLATGVLPLVTGSFTRLAQFYTKSEKSYEGIIRFGFATDTYDADGERVGEVSTISPALEDIQALAAKSLGTIEQTPPPFSAKKINGVPAYKLARKQKEVRLEPVQVEVKEFSIIAVADGRAHFRARVASGTYMRSIAHEMGQRLACGAHLESLRRTAVAEFNITQAHTIPEIENQKYEPKQSNPRHPDRSVAFPQGKEAEGPAVTCAEDTDSIVALFIHPRTILPDIPCVTADDSTTARIRAGRPINLPELSRSRQVKVFHGQSELIAIATRVAGTLFHPKIVFPAESK